MGAKANCDEVKAAYVWENTRIDQWIANITANPPLPAAGTIGVKFAEIWVEYFKEIKDSNEEAARILSVADDAEGKKASKKIKRVFLPRRPLEKLGVTVGEVCGRSDYFDSLSTAIDLEIDAGAAIRTHLSRP